jgi:glycine/D-amino acid oxidase-like deaminating enzyme
MAGTMTDPRRGASFWLETLPELATAPLPTWRNTADVAIVGAGYTGLWTAYYLKQREPALEICIYEAERAGFGASGRNGGWCMGTAWGVDRLLGDPQTRTRGLALARALFDTVDEVGRVCQAENIDAHFHKGGSLNVATIPFRADALRSERDHLAALGFTDSDYEWLPPARAQDRLNMTPNCGALHFKHCAAVHPARLVLGLAEVVARSGVHIFESTPVTAIASGRVTTARGTVAAKSILRATEGYTGSIAGAGRRLLPIYSMVTATEPLPTRVWDEIGLRDRETFGDGRRVVIYGQRTLDDRLVFGGRGGYDFGSRRRRYIAADDPNLARVKALIPKLFPMLAGYRITHGWGGMLGVQRNWRPAVHFDRATGLGWAGGYVGEGVGASNLAGRILADLVTGRDSPLIELPWVGDVARSWEPEPLRWLGARLLEQAAARADAEEFTNNRPSRFWGGVFRRLVG